jgi:hypothetical protein
MFALSAYRQERDQMSFEENPLFFVLAVVVVTEVWMRVRQPLFAAFKRARRDTSR